MLTCDAGLMGSCGAAYAYRADGMRIRKVTGQFMWWNEPNSQEAGYYTDETDLGAPTYRYFYDGQMMQEDDKTIPNMMGSPTIAGNSYALGARGVDRIRPWTYANGVRTYGQGQERYPVYDGHGNMILTLRKDGGDFLHENERSYTVWGGWRSGADTGDPAQRYCASLGHVADDESSMIYMRARYYEPLTGRFISEDPACDGANWFVYCGNEPVLKVDPDGRMANGWILAHGAALTAGVYLGLYFGKQLWNFMVQPNPIRANHIRDLEDYLTLYNSVVLDFSMNVLGAVLGLAAGLFCFLQRLGLDQSACRWELDSW